MKRIVIGMAAAMSLFATGALAADLAARPYVKAPVMVDPVWSWTGFYVGANGGYSWGRSRTDVSLLQLGNRCCDRAAGRLHHQCVVRHERWHRRWPGWLQLAERQLGLRYRGRPAMVG